MQDNTNIQPSSDVVPARKSHRRFWLICGAVLLVASCFGAGFFGSTFASYLSGNKQFSQSTDVHDGNERITQEEEDVADVVQKVSPSVVSVITSQVKTSAYYGEQEYQGAGTGIVVSQDGYIVTNKHVVADADTVNIIMNDGTTYENVKVIGADPLNDIAFLKITDPKNLSAVELGDSKTIRIGQNVIAIGNALGQYQNTVTRGIISGKGRPVAARLGAGAVEALTDLIQTDAAINSGNSGGPLLNTQGQVIGINTAVAQDAQGIGFAIPIAAIKGMLKGVLAGKGVKHAYLGVRYVTITPEVEKKYSLPVKQGSYLVADGGGSAIVEDGPADKAGLKNKDIITKINGVEVGESGSVSSLIAEYEAGETVKLTVFRDSKALVISVVLSAYQP